MLGSSSFIGPRHALCCIALLVACTTDANEQGHLSAGRLTTALDVERVPFDEHLRSACGDLGLRSAGKVDLFRWPYLQKVTDGSAEILWVSRGSGAVELTLSTPDGTVDQRVSGLRDVSAIPREGAQFVAELSGLEPGATYCYELSDADGTSLFRGAFVSAPAEGEPATVQFTAMGDLGKRSPDQYAVLEQLEGVRSDFVVLTGDIAYDDGTREQFENNFFGVYRDMLSAIPFFPASGNHDYHADDAEPFREVFAMFENGGAKGLERWYSFDWGPVHIAVLDTEKYDTPQRDWLAEDLAASESQFTVVVMHEPPFSSGSHGSSDAAREMFVPLFENRVDLVLAGHDHHYERTDVIDGVTYVVTGGGGRGTRGVGESDFTASSIQVAHFVHVLVEGDELRVVAIDATGEPFDSVVIPARVTGS